MSHPQGKRYFHSGWNVLDFLVAANGWAIIILEFFFPDRFLLTLKIARLARLLRPLRALSIIPTLRSLVNSLLHAIQVGDRGWQEAG